jgi:hypothetical protein
MSGKPFRRSKGEAKASAVEWAAGLLGLWQDDERDPAHLMRNWRGTHYETLWHDSYALPPQPLEGDNRIIKFHTTPDLDGNSWTITEVGAGTQLALQDEKGGVAKATLGAADNDYQHYISLSEFITIPSDGTTTFKAKIRIADVDQCDFFVGACAKIAGANFFDARQDSVGFYLTDGSPLLRLENGIAGDARLTVTAQALEDDTWYDLGWNSWSDSADSNHKEINFFFNGERIGTHRAKYPTTEMAFAFGIRNGQAVANALSIKQSYVLQH